MTKSDDASEALKPTTHEINAAAYTALDRPRQFGPVLEPTAFLNGFRYGANWLYDKVWNTRASPVPAPLADETQSVIAALEEGLSLMGQEARDVFKSAERNKDDPEAYDEYMNTYREWLRDCELVSKHIDSLSTPAISAADREALDEQTVDDMASKVWDKFLKRNEGTFDHMYRGEFIVACRTLVYDNKLRALAEGK